MINNFKFNLYEQILRITSAFHRDLATPNTVNSAALGRPSGREQEPMKQQLLKFQHPGPSNSEMRRI
jgi:hypothetical protein